MRILLAATLLVYCASVGFAQNQNNEKLCNSAPVTTVDNDAGVTVQSVTLSGKWGSNEATVYLPDKETADGAVLFSHSAIHSESGASVDLLPMAFTLARAGAAVIMPRRTLIWPPTDQSTNREGEVVVCAEHWLIDHTKVFNDGKGTRDENNIVLRFAYAYVGPRLCTPNPIEDNDGHPQSDDSYCHYSGPFYSDPCGPGGLKYCLLGHPEIWFPVGETEGGDNTRDIIRDGGLKAAQALHRQLGLAPIVELASPKARLGTLAVENRP